jgi:hypothetical protein
MWHDIAIVVRDLQRAFSGAIDPYRPELHYMRGPGPKCQAKRSGAPRSAEPFAAATALDDIAQAHA